ncbi:hypothetical protein [Ideonella livida]|uniref:BACON domain-containing protein n=1 Tax=Ideonella livida TaxID=2707176 RepID=A0A7C9PJK1_9BURK|nr:hypothetical protein [Ideonella livida]NDY93637.1 hypothetical protein [Ideonella livida]
MIQQSLRGATRQGTPDTPVRRRLAALSPLTAAGLRRAALALGATLTAWLLAACGGGGGGSGEEPFRLDFDAGPVELQTVQGQAAPAVTLNVNSRGETRDPIYVGAEASGPGVLTPLEVDVRGNSAVVKVQADPWLTPGTYTGTLTLLACRDTRCLAHHPGSPHVVRFSTTIHPRLSLPVTPLALSAPQGGAAVTTRVALPAGLPGGLTVGTDADWLQARQDGAELVLSAAPAGLAQGLHTATVQLRQRQPVSQEASLTVQLTVTTGLLTPAQVHLDLDARATPESLRGTLPVTVAPGVVATRWQASVDVSWLRLVRASGTLAEPLVWEVDAAQLAQLPYGTRTDALLRLQLDGVDDGQVRLSVGQLTPTLDSVDLLALTPGQPGTVLAWARGLDGLDTPQALRAAVVVDEGRVSPLAVSRLGPQLLAVSLPALPAGSHSLRLHNPLNLASPTRTLQVLAPVDRSAQGLDWAGTLRNLQWDAVGQALFMHRSDTGELLRVDLSGAQARVSRRALPALREFSLSRDHDTLLAATRDGRWLLLDPATLATRDDLPLANSPAAAPSDLPLPVTGDGLAWVRTDEGWAGLVVMDSLTQAPNVWLSPWEWSFYQGPWAAVSPDGRRLLMTQSAGLSPPPPLLRREASGGRSGVAASLARLPAQADGDYFYAASANREGSRWLLDHARLVDFDLQPRGRLTLPEGWVGLASALSGDGRRAYVYSMAAAAIGTYAEPAPIPPRVQVFDTGAEPDASGQLPWLGFVPVPEAVACRVTQGPTPCQPYRAHLLLTDDQRTLLLAGDRRLLVLPVPAGPLRAQAARGPRATAPLAGHRLR